MKHQRQSIGKQKAIALCTSKWWEGRTDREIAEFQMLTDELCMPFGEFHRALESALGRPVFTHELGMNWYGIVEELFGKRPAPSFEDIIGLIPPEKLLVVVAPEREAP